MKTVCLLMLVVVLPCSLFAVDQCDTNKGLVVRSQQQVGALCDAVKNKSQLQYNDCTVVSPDKSMAVCLKTDKLTKNETDITHLYLERGKRLIKLATYDDLGPSWKPIWSPDSRHVALSYTNGGAACCWFVDIFDVKTGKHHSISRFAQQDMAVRKKCEFSNTYFSHWVDAQTAVIWLEGREPSETCSRGPENDQAYEVELRTGRILERFSPEKTRQIELE